MPNPILHGTKGRDSRAAMNSPQPLPTQLERVQTKLAALEAMQETTARTVRGPARRGEPMPLLRVLLLMLGSWLGGVFVTFAVVTGASRSWEMTAIFAAVAVAIGVALITTLRGDARIDTRVRR